MPVFALVNRVRQRQSVDGAFCVRGGSVRRSVMCVRCPGRPPSDLDLDLDLIARLLPVERPPRSPRYTSVVPVTSSSSWRGRRRPSCELLMMIDNNNG